MLRSTSICLAFFVALTSARRDPSTYVVRFQWNLINYTWPSHKSYTDAKEDGFYVEKDNIVSGIKLWKDKMYLMIPRYRDGVPVTLAVTSATVQDGTTAPLLEPYPSWEMQKIGDCRAFQNVYNVEIDWRGRMWVLDTGRVATMTSESIKKCAPKMFVFDLENGGRLLRTYVFSKDVFSYDTGILNDLVIDHEHGGMAYITDSDEINPGIIVYSWKNDTAWKVHHQSMHYVDDAVDFILEHIHYMGKVNIDGIALSPASSEGPNRTLYYSPLSSFNVFVVKTQALIDAKHAKAGVEREKFIHEHIRILGRKPSQAEGMVMSNTGRLYVGLLAKDVVLWWDSNSGDSFIKGQNATGQDHHRLQWPGSFAFDDKGQLWVFTNRMYRYANSTLDINQANFRAHVAKVNMKSYQYYENGTAPV